MSSFPRIPRARGCSRIKLTLPRSLASDGHADSPKPKQPNNIKNDGTAPSCLRAQRILGEAEVKGSLDRIFAGEVHRLPGQTSRGTPGTLPKWLSRRIHGDCVRCHRYEPATSLRQRIRQLCERHQRLRLRQRTRQGEHTVSGIIFL